MFAKWRIFPKIATTIFIAFMGLMILVTIVANSRPSGSTRQDMAQAQLLRKEAAMKNHTISERDPHPSVKSD